jgi:hypothetical protein
VFAGSGINAKKKNGSIGPFFFSRRMGFSPKGDEPHWDSNNDPAISEAVFVGNSTEFVFSQQFHRILLRISPN